MAYNEAIGNRIREALADKTHVEEKEMMGGLCFMLDDKMVAGVMKEEMMCRIGAAAMDEALQHDGCRPMQMQGRVMKAYVLVDENALRSKKQFDYWMRLCLDFNKEARASKKPKRRSL